jgi:sensor c-di-GMP phosphodiesterase-like protein
MQTAQRIIVNYRRKRLAVCVAVALLTLITTLSIRFISQRNLNQQRTVAFVTHAVEALDKILLPLQASREELLPLVGRPCIAAHLLLRRQAATLQTVRSVGLIKDGILYCSSIFGNRDVPIRQLQPALPHPEPLLVLSTDQTLLIGSPILIQWYPLPRSAEDGRG